MQRLMRLRRPILQGGDWQDRRKEVGYRVYRVGLDQQEHPRGLPQCVRNTKNTCTIDILDVCEPISIIILQKDAQIQFISRKTWKQTVQFMSSFNSMARIWKPQIQFMTSKNEIVIRKMKTLRNRVKSLPFENVTISEIRALLIKPMIFFYIFALVTFWEPPRQSRFHHVFKSSVRESTHAISLFLSTILVVMNSFLQFPNS